MNRKICRCSFSLLKIDIQRGETCRCLDVFSQLPIVAIMGNEDRQRRNDEGGEGGNRQTLTDRHRETNREK